MTNLNVLKRNFLIISRQWIAGDDWEKECPGIRVRASESVKEGWGLLERMSRIDCLIIDGKGQEKEAVVLLDFIKSHKPKLPLILFNIPEAYHKTLCTFQSYLLIHNPLSLRQISKNGTALN